MLVFDECKLPTSPTLCECAQGSREMMAVHADTGGSSSTPQAWRFRVLDLGLGASSERNRRASGVGPSYHAGNPRMRQDVCISLHYFVLRERPVALGGPSVVVVDECDGLCRPIPQHACTKARPTTPTLLLPLGQNFSQNKGRNLPSRRCSTGPPMNHP